MFWELIREMKMIEGEMNNFIMVWSIATTSLCYCYTIGKMVEKGIGRLIALVPPIIILLLLPLRLTSLHLAGFTAFFLSWLSTFKLFLFAFSKGPLVSSSPHTLSLPHFLLLASFPIKFEHDNNSIHRITGTPPSLMMIGWRKFAVLVIFHALSLTILISDQKNEIFHPLFTTMLCILSTYFILEITLSFATAIIRKLLKAELEQPFDKPHLSSSVQEFWGRRWNLMVTRILHPTVYEPMVKATSHVIGRKWAPLPAVVATFAVSGLMHELIFYYIHRDTWEEPCWDSICFFLINGVCVALQIGYKKAFEPKQPLLPTVVSRILTMAFVVSTSVCLFMPPYLRCDGIAKTKRDYVDLLQFLKNVYHHCISPLKPI